MTMFSTAIRIAVEYITALDSEYHVSQSVHSFNLLGNSKSNIPNLYVVKLLTILLDSFQLTVAIATEEAGLSVNWQQIIIISLGHCKRYCSTIARVVFGIRLILEVFGNNEDSKGDDE